MMPPMIGTIGACTASIRVLVVNALVIRQRGIDTRDTMDTKLRFSLGVLRVLSVE
jgi:hypothetical protein